MSAGYFESEGDRLGVDVDELDEHEVDLPEISLDPDEMGPLTPYFERLTRDAHHAYQVAAQARSTGVDPETEPEIPFAEDLASRVEALVGPEGVDERIRDLSSEMDREALALTVSKEVAEERFCDYDGPEEALDGAIRTGLAILTEGILVAPLEGVAEVKVRENGDGTNYADVYFAGPIRAAGGTGQALSVLIADVVRRELGLGAYQSTTGEVERFKEEIPAYKKAANLQYTPDAREIEMIVQNLPVGVNGEGTEQEEVSGQRDLPRVETNALRGGACLVLAEGLTLKAPKILKHVDKLGLEGWEFLEDYIEEMKGDDDGSDEGDDKKKIKPVDKFIQELTAGRPVFSHPMAPGGFRLRYGRCRTAGLAATAIHPALCGLVDDFLAVGTQLKTERPGKGTLVTPCDTIDPPIVRLDDGTVREVDTYEEAVELADRVELIVDLGEMLVPFGEFLENNKPLPPSPWCREWWERLLEAEGHQVPEVPDDAARAALRFAERTGTPLHPRFTLFWDDIEREDLERLRKAMGGARWTDGRLALPFDEGTREMLETLGATHAVDEASDGPTLVVDERCSLPLVRGLGYRIEEGALEHAESPREGDGSVVELVSRMTGVEVRPRATCRIGARMGRPEKAAHREMSPPVHGLFPLGGAGGLQRLVKDAAKKGEIGSEEARGYDTIETGIRACPDCETETLFLDCPECGTRTRPREDWPESRRIPLQDLIHDALDRMGEKKLDPNTKGVQGLISETKLPEPIEKAILRAKREVWVFKDGTSRYDMTDLPLTQFRPEEIGTSVDDLREMGYEEDVEGEPLTSPDQLVELKPQDLVINEDALAYMARVAKFVDDELTRLYGLKPFYDVEEPRDLIGHLAVGLAPHTSGGVLCRIIGTTRAAGHWGHPYFHAAKRRNCFTGDTEVLVYRDGSAEKVRLNDLVDEPVDEAGRPIDAHGTQAADAPGDLEVLSLDPETREPVRHPVTKLIRGSTDEWVEIETTTHRSITVTPNHEVLVRREGELTTVQAADVTEGDEVPVGTSLPRTPQAPTFNLARELASFTDEAEIRLRGIDGWLRSLVERIGRETAAEAAAAGDYFTEKPARWYGSFPLRHFAGIVDAGHASWDDLPDGTRLGLARDGVTLPVRVEADGELCRLLGLYLAEGHARSTDSAHQVSWRASTPEIAGKIEDLVESVFEHPPSTGEDGTKITLCSRLAYLLFTHVWGLGEGAEDKRVPGWCYDLPEAQVVEMLGGLFDGDGTVVTDPTAVRFYSKSGRLLEDVGTLLQAAGVFSRFAPGKPREPGSVLEERYEGQDSDPPETLDPVHALVLTGADVKHFAAMVHADHPDKRERLQYLSVEQDTGRILQGAGSRGPADEGPHHLFDRVASVETSDAQDATTYCIDVDTGSADLATKNVLLGNGLYQVRCDGDEDCLMLLLDGLLNFSRWYLPDRRGGQMDAPLTLSIHVDPEEIDGEAHNIELDSSYPLEFYEATKTIPGPKEVAEHLEIVEDRLGTPGQYHGLGFTHDTRRLDDGPALSSYKTIDTMMEKMEGQLQLGDKIRAVDAGDVASRVICDHFLPDIQGNLNAFTRQTVRCAKCNTKYRRVPLTGRCRKCKNTLTMTVHEASVKKYVDIAQEVAENYAVDDYTQQRLKLIEDALESLFQNDKVEKAKLSDFL